MNCYLPWNLKDMTNISAEKLQRNIAQQVAYLDLYRNELIKEAYRFNIASILKYASVHKASFGADALAQKASDCLIVFLHAIALRKQAFFTPSDSENSVHSKGCKNLHRLMLENIKATMRYIDYSVLLKRALGQTDINEMFALREELYNQVFPEETIIDVCARENINDSFFSIVDRENSTHGSFLDYDIQNICHLDPSICELLCARCGSLDDFEESEYGILGSIMDSLKTPFLKHAGRYYSFVTRFSLVNIHQKLEHLYPEEEEAIEEPVDEEVASVTSTEAPYEVSSEVLPEEEDEEVEEEPNELEAEEELEEVPWDEDVEESEEPVETEEAEDDDLDDYELFEDDELLEEQLEEAEDAVETEAEAEEDPYDGSLFDDVDEGEPEEEPAPAPVAEPETVEEVVIEPVAEPQPEPVLTPVEEPELESTPDSAPAPEPAVEPEPEMEPIVEQEPVVEQAPEPQPESAPESEPQAEPETVEEAVIEPVAEPEPVPAPESEPQAEPETVEEAVIEPVAKPEPVPAPAVEPEPEMESAPEPTPAPQPKNLDQPLLLLDAIAQSFTKENSLTRFVAQHTYQDRKELSDIIDSAWQACVKDGRDKMFTIPDTKISVVVFKASKDPMLEMQRRQNVGAMMYLDQADSWDALELPVNEAGGLLPPGFSTITRYSFTDWQWRLVEKMGQRLLERRKK